MSNPASVLKEEVDALKTWKKTNLPKDVRVGITVSLDKIRGVLNGLRRGRRGIPSHEAIISYLHCKLCLREFAGEPIRHALGQEPATTPRDYARLNVGFTKLGLQVWCVRHDCNVAHIDFQNMTHPANTTGTKGK